MSPESETGGFGEGGGRTLSTLLTVAPQVGRTVSLHLYPLSHPKVGKSRFRQYSWQCKLGG